MLLYKTKYADENGQQTLAKWDGTQRDARSRRIMLKEEGHRDIETEDVNVPTDKAGLLKWLNENATGE